MAIDDVREQAKAEIRRQVWGSQRGIATRAFIREHPEIVTEFEQTGDIIKISCSQCDGSGGDDAKVQCNKCDGTGMMPLVNFPAHVTKASVLLELHMRERRKEASVEAKKWAAEHPEEVEKMRQQIREEMEKSKEVEA